ncbi:interferon alpha/beta receptor 2-like isoform X2 [Synchiropus splendidus]|uniref:interferon alpha/beta receptor 2-like isoform X2 n=1 Tax=Synchiropus splendidus TaxID=270530 RepID=UPI00237E3544|nr:interferon alpha/beta receptor 2-like isoform X2 [Synchiropus splendidus]
MFCWLLLLLQLECIRLCSTAQGVLLPPPSSVSVSSFNMEHRLHFLPGAHTPAGARFSVQVTRLRKKSRWRPVSNCSQLTVGQTCDITAAITDPLDLYLCRVRALTLDRTSNWTMSEQFMPMMDTLIGPPELALSGCGTCLILRVTVPTSVAPQLRPHLQSLYRHLDLQVTRVSDRAQFTLTLPYSEESVIPHLQPGAQYCVSVRVGALTQPRSVAGPPVCALSSPPRSRSSEHVVLGLLVAFCGLGLLLILVLLYGVQLSRREQQRRLDRRPRT